jgi:hypothetical protein
MSSEITRVPDLEIALIAKIREEGSKDLLNALEYCEIKVERSKDDTYAVMIFSAEYCEGLEWDLCSEVGVLGVPLEIFRCNCESPNQGDTVISHVTLRGGESLFSAQTLDFELINQLLASPHLEEEERLFQVKLRETRLETEQVRDFGETDHKITDSDSSTH